jgi:arylsulfatase A-like enzyme
MRQLYTASIRLMDDWLARIVTALEQRGLLEDTIVVVTSDHGENLGEGEMIGHALSLDDRLIRVPFVVMGPAQPLASLRASLVDVPGWLAASIGLQDHPWTEADGERRVAVAQFDAASQPDNETALGVVQQWGLGDEALRRLTTSFACATNGQRKLLRRLGGEELVDLDVDPLEVAPVKIGPDEDARWADELKVLRSALDQAEAAEMPGVTSTPEGAAAGVEIADLEARMKLLGYL